MKHARSDYNRIQDPDHKIPEDEPVFLLRGQDQIAANVVNYWANCAEAIGADPKIIKLAREQARKMMEWSKKKVPDL